MIVLAAHGTRAPQGALVVEDLAEQVRACGVEVRVAYADVHGPDVTSVLRELGRPAVVVPAFLSTGYHVSVDIPQQVAASGHRCVVVTDAFGPAPELVGAVVDCLLTAGYRSGDALSLAAAGSRDPQARSHVRRAARLLAARLHTPVHVGFIAGAEPAICDVVQRVRRRGRRVAVASWLLAPGDFSQRLARSGADVVAPPIGAHPGVVQLVLRRYHEALRLAPAS